MRRLIARGSTPWRLLGIVLLLALLGTACGAADSDGAETAVADTVESSGGSEAFATTVAVSDEAVEGGGAEDGEAFDLAADQEAPAGQQGEAQPATDAPAAAPADGADPAAPLGTGAATVTPTAADLGRKLIFTAELSVEVDDVAAASSEATAIVESMGGFLFGQNTVGGSEASSQLTFKVLPDDFNRTLEALGSVGELRNQSVTTDDVTERIVDLDSRITVAELGVARLRAALEGSQSLADYAELERLLLDRESNLEVMRGQIRTLQGRVDLATITLLLIQDRLANAIDLRISSYEGHDRGQSCPGQGETSYEQGLEATVCFDITNLGDQTLTNIAITDTVLEIDESTDLIEVFGSLDELAPGQAVLVAVEIKPERDLTLRTRITAIPTDGTSQDPTGPAVSTRGEFGLNTFEPDRDPGFGDGFGAGADIVKGLWVAVKVTVGFLILPLLILVPLLAVARLTAIPWWRRRQANRPTTAPYAASGAYSPPPPPPPPAATAGPKPEVPATPAPSSTPDGGDEEG